MEQQNPADSEQPADNEPKEPSAVLLALFPILTAVFDVLRVKRGVKLLLLSGVTLYRLLIDFFRSRVPKQVQVWGGAIRWH